MDHKIHLSPTTYYYNDDFKLSSDSISYSEIANDIDTFENKVQSYLETDRYCLALNSGTAAIHLALQLAGVTHGDYVLCQSHTFVACANAIMYQGAIPVFIDSEEFTWNIDPDILEAAVKDLSFKNIYPKAIIVACLYGMPFDFDAVCTFAKANHIKVIEDSAEALGSSYKSKMCGTLADFGILSFNYNKIITSGGGGVLVCKNEEDYHQGLKIATQAKEKAPHYEHVQIGYNYRMGHINAKIGAHQMDVLEKNIISRQELNKWYQELFKNIDGITVQKEQSQEMISNHWLSAILVDATKTGGITREDIRLALEKDHIESRPLWKPMHMQPLYKGHLYYGRKVCETLFENGLCLPSGSNIIDDDRERIKKSILALFAG